MAAQIHGEDSLVLVLALYVPLKKSSKDCPVSLVGMFLKYVCLPTPSPIGEVFRARLRQFPSLVTCCTIDWFSAWPQEALHSVATSFLNELPELEASPAALRGMVRENLCFIVCMGSAYKKIYQPKHTLHCVFRLQCAWRSTRW